MPDPKRKQALLDLIDSYDDSNRVQIPGGGSIHRGKAETIFDNFLYQEEQKRKQKLGVAANIESGSGFLSYVIDPEGASAIWGPTVGPPGTMPMPNMYWSKLTKDVKRERKERITDLAKKAETADNWDNTWQATKEGAEQGLYHFAELLTGADLPEEALGWQDITPQELDEMTEKKEITKEQAEKLKERLEDFGLVKDVASAVTTSALIMGGLVATGGTSGIGLTSQGIKFFSKEGLKLFGKEIAKQGVNSWKLMGGGANIKALNAAKNNMEKESKYFETDFFDYAAMYAKELLIENASAFAEGASEGLIREMKLGSVGIKRLMKEPKAWKELAKNFRNHGINSILFETSTEQTTSMLQDLFRGTHSSVFNLLSDEHRGEAFRELVVQAFTGTILGGVMGTGKIFTEKPLQEIEKDYGKEVADAVRQVASNKETQKKLATEIQKSQEKRVKNEEDAKVKKSVKESVNAGAKGLDSQLNLFADEEVKKAVEQTEENAPKIAERISKKAKQQRTKEDSNYLTDLLIMGDAKLKDFFNNLSENSEEFSYTFEGANDLLGEVGRDKLEKIATKVEDKIVSTAADQNLQEALPNREAFPNPKMRRDALIALALGVKDFSSFEARWAPVAGADFTQSVIESIQNTKQQPKTEDFDLLIDEYSNYIIEELNEVERVKILQAGEDAIILPSLSEEAQAYQQALENETKAEVPKFPFTLEEDQESNTKYQMLGNRTKQNVDYALNVVKTLMEIAQPKETKRTRKYGEQAAPERTTIRLNSKDKPYVEQNLRKALRGRGVTDAQIDFVFDYMKSNGIQAMSTEDLAMEVALGYARTVQIETATYPLENTRNDRFYSRGRSGEKTQLYKKLNVPGGMNYTENNILTPGIVPAIKGHPRFAKEEAIGWFRSDVQTVDPLGNIPKEGRTVGRVPTKTRRILEIQSDFFQKARSLLSKGASLVRGPAQEGFQIGDRVEFRFYDRQGNPIEDDLIAGTLVNYIQGDVEFLPEENQMEPAPPDMYVIKDEEGGIHRHNEEEGELSKLEPKSKDRESKSGFLNLLAKGDNWVSFFIRSIIQDSAKQGYKKALFPAGETAALIEGHETLTQELKRLQSLKERYENITDKDVAEAKAKLKEAKANYKKLIQERIAIEKPKARVPFSEKTEFNIDSYQGKLLNDMEDFQWVRVEHVSERPEIWNDKLYGHDDYQKHREAFEGKGKYNGYYIHGYNTDVGVLDPGRTKIVPITEERAREIWNELNLRRNANDIIHEDQIKNLAAEAKDLEGAESRLKGVERDIKRLKSQGIEKLKPIEAFYEKKVTNILLKLYGKENVKRIKDEYGNEWSEVNIENIKGLDTPFYQMSADRGGTTTTEPGKPATFKDLLGDFPKITTVGRLFQLLEDRELQDSTISPIINLLQSTVTDVKVTFDENIVGIGEYDSATHEIKLNSNARFDDTKNGLYDKGLISKALAHEALHAFTIRFMQSDTLEGSSFYKQIRQVMDSVRKALENPVEHLGSKPIYNTYFTEAQLNKLLQNEKYMKDIYLHLSKPEEFIAGIFSRNSILPEVMAHIKGGGPGGPLMRLFNDIMEALKAAYKKITGRDFKGKTALEEITKIFSANIPALASYHGVAHGTIGRASVETDFLLNVGQRNFEADRETIEELEDRADLEDLEDMEDLEQEDETANETLAEKVDIDDITQLVATLMGKTTIEYNNWVRETSWTGHFEALFGQEGLDSKNGNIIDEKLKYIWKTSYRKKIKNFEAFKRQFFTQKRRRAFNVNVKRFLSVELNYHEETGFGSQSWQKRSGPKVTVKELPHNFKSPTGKRKNALREDIILESFVQDVQKLLGLPEGTFSVALINDFTEVRRGQITRVNKPTRLNSRLMGVSEDTSASAVLANGLWEQTGPNGERFLYLGNFGGKNTLPILVLKGDVVKDLVPKLANITRAYEAAAKMPSGKLYGSSLSYAMRMLLEERWFNPQFQLDEGGMPVNGIIYEGLVQHSQLVEQIEQAQTTQEKEALEKELANVKKQIDWNKIQKRGTKWVFPKTSIENDNAYIRKYIKPLVEGRLTGFRYDKGRITLRTAVFNSTDEGSITVTDINGNEIALPIQSILRNSIKDENGRGTSTTDGATFYLIGEFDDVYSKLHGTIKSGTIKNVYGSKVGQEPIFIKHAMHGVHPASYLGQIMKKNNLALLISDESAKVWSGGKNNLSELAAEGSQAETLDLDIEQFARIKEEQNTSRLGGREKQLQNGSGFSEDYNIAIKKAVAKVGDLKKATEGNIARALGVLKNYYDNITNNSDEEFLSMVIDMVNSPSSPKQEILATAFGPLFSGPKEAVLANYKGMFQHPLFAEEIKRKLRKPLTSFLEFNIPGWRAALTPNVGYGNKQAQVDTVLSDKNAIELAFNSTPILTQAVPDVHLRKLLKDYDTNFRRLRYLQNRSDDVAQEIETVKERIEDAKERISALVEEEVSNPYSLVDVSKATDTLKNLYSQILDNKTGRLKNGWAIISQEDADRFGLKAGDSVIAVVTPTDSVLSATAIKIAGIMPTYGPNKVADNNTIVMNSEYIQSMVGKDFDIDTISLIPFDEEYWDIDDYKTYTKTLEAAQNSYLKEMINSYKSVLGNRPGINKESIFTEELRTEYNQELLGESSGEDFFLPVGHGFHYINDAYNSEVSTIISQRLMHTALSAIDFRTAPLKGSKQTIPALITRNPNWFNVHNLHINLTTDIIDFPNRTSKLKYNSDPESEAYIQNMFQATFGLEEEVPKIFIDVFNSVTRALFQGSFDLAKNQKRSYYSLRRDTASEKIAGRFDHEEFVKAIRQQQHILRAVKEGNKDIMKMAFGRINQGQYESALKNGANTEKTKKTYTEKERIANAIIDSFPAEGFDIENYPLFKMILSIDPEIPIPGNNYFEHLITESKTAQEMLLNYPKLLDVYQKGVEEDATKAKFLERRDEKGSFPVIGGIEVDKIAIALGQMTKELDFLDFKKPKQNSQAWEKMPIDKRQELERKYNRSLEMLRREAIAITHAIDQPAPLIKNGQASPAESAEQFFNDMARRRAYPKLMKAMMENESVDVNRGMEGKRQTLTWKGREIFIERHPEGQLAIITALPSNGGKLSRIAHNSLLFNENPEWQEIRNAFFDPIDGIFSSDVNRYKFNTIISFQRNTTPDQRLKIAKNFINQRIYGTKPKTDIGFFNREEVVAFWISFVSQMSNFGVADNTIKNFIMRQDMWDYKVPHKYPYNTNLFDLMAGFEPSLLKHYAQLYSLITTEYRTEIDIKEGREIFESQPPITRNTKYQMASTFDTAHGELSHFVLAFKDHLTKKGSNIINFVKFNSKLKEGTGPALAELRRMIKDVAVMRALSENGVPVDKFIHDISKLSTAQLEAKYSKLELPSILLSIENHLLSGEAWVKAESQETKNINGTLRAAYWVLQSVRDNEQMSSDKMTKWQKLKLKLMNMDLAALNNEKKIFNFTNVNAPVGEGLSFESIHPDELTVSDVNAATRSYSGEKHNPIGHSSLAAAKVKKIHQVLNFFNVKMARQVETFQEYINFVGSAKARAKSKSNYGHMYKSHPDMQYLHELGEQADLQEKNTGAIEHEIYMLAQNFMLDPRYKGLTMVTESTVTGRVVRYAAINKETGEYEYYSQWYGENGVIEKALTDLTPEEKIKVATALKIRELYDVQVTDLIKTASNYLQRTYSELKKLGDTHGASQIAGLINRFEEYKRAAKKHRGTYLPHQFNKYQWKQIWKSQYMQGIRNTVLNSIDKNKKLREKGEDYNKFYAGIDPNSEVGKKEIERLILQKAESVFETQQAGFPGTYVISNFLKRSLTEETETGYSTSSDVHYNYINTFINGMKNDLIHADYTLYLARAKAVGESPAVAGAMRAWFSNQSQEKSLHSQAIDISQLKKGMQINFFHTMPKVDGESGITSDDGILISGTVKKIQGNQVILNVETENIALNLRRKRKKRSLSSDFMFAVNPGRKAMDWQYNELEWFRRYEVLPRDFWKNNDFTKLTYIEANDLIIDAIDEALKNPEQLATYDVRDAYIVDDLGRRRNKINRYIREGWAERMKGKIRELHNLELMDGKFHGMDRFQYEALKTASYVYDSVVGILPKISALMFMGAAASGKATVTNYAGAYLANMTDSFFHNKKMKKEGKELYERIASGQISKLDDDQRRFYDIVTSLGLTTESNLLSISLESANINAEDMVSGKKFVEILKWAADVWKDSSGYTDYVDELNRLTEQYYTESNQIKQVEIQRKIIALKNAWAVKAHMDISEADFKQLNDEELAELAAKIRLGEVDKANYAEESGLNKGALLSLLGRLITKKMYTSKYGGVGLQATAERLRLPAFFIGYNTALQNGYSHKEAITYGINSIELRHAFYGAPYKQYGANTKTGRFLMQFSQYAFNAFTRLYRNMALAIPQILENMPSGDRTALRKLQFLFKRNIEHWDNEQKKWEKKTAYGMQETNIIAAQLKRTIIGFTLMQAGTRLFYGITNFQDPMIQLAYGILELGAKGAKGEDDLDDDIAWLITDMLFFVGVPYKLITQMVSSEDGAAGIAYKGRVAQQDQFLKRMANTWEEAMNVYEDDYMEGKKTIADPFYLVDELALGIKLTGWTGADENRAFYEREGFLLPDQFMELPPSNRPIETLGEGVDAQRRFIEAFNWKTWIPLLDILMEKR